MGRWSSGFAGFTSVPVIPSLNPEELNVDFSMLLLHSVFQVFSAMGWNEFKWIRLSIFDWILSEMRAVLYFDVALLIKKNVSIDIGF